MSAKSQASNVAAAGVEPETPHMSQASENNWASFEDSTEHNVPNKTPNSNTLKSGTTEATPEATFSNPLDLLLFELSGPLVPTTGGMSEVPSSDNVPTTTTLEKATTTWDFPPTSMGKTTASPSQMALPSNAAPPPQAEPHAAEEFIEVSHAHKPSSMQYPPSVSVGCSSITQPTNAPVKAVASNNEVRYACSMDFLV